jgi:hypothetical protein
VWLDTPLAQAQVNIVERLLERSGSLPSPQELRGSEMLAPTSQHPAGPPTCWCWPPLPGLPLALARAHGVDPARSILVGRSPAHRTLAATLGAGYVPT